jgi:hypothetical protein
MANQRIDYRGYTLEVKAQGAGWAILIWEPGGGFTLPETPHNPDQSKLNELIAEAQGIVDRWITNKGRRP